jgi:endonuclease/exonuclease/phosphatase family metal-dependent hydrolase
MMRALTWNIYHGRVYQGPTPRSALAEFRRVLAGERWDVALLQEAPPRWHRGLCEGLGVQGELALTARNSVAPLRGWLADWNPDLLGAWEGGSNQLLVRPPWRILEIDRLVLARLPERRRLLWARLLGPGDRQVALGCVHLTRRHPRYKGNAAAHREAVRAAEWSRAAADGLPLLLGGDFNVSPDHAPEAFAELERRFGLAPPTARNRIDHLLASGLDLVEPPRALPRERREVPGPGGRRLLLSDHAPVAAAYAWPPAPGGTVTPP